MTTPTTALAALTLGGMSSDVITGAGLVIGIVLLAVEHVRWWRGGGKTFDGGGGRDPKALIPWWVGMVVGTLMVSCPAGLMGTGAGIIRWGGNGIGDFTVSTLTGQESGEVASSAAPQLDPAGALMVTALVLTLFIMRKAFTKVIKGKFWPGVVAGCLLGIGTGIFAVVGQIVVPTVNEIGAVVMETAVSGDFL